MAKKKEVSHFDLFYDLLVKLNNVYKDVYIIDNKYCISGKETDEEALGDIVCVIDDKYRNAMNSLGFSGSIFIENIRNLKSQMKEIPDEFELFMDKLKSLSSKELPDDKLESLTYMLEADTPIEDICKEINLDIDMDVLKESFKESRKSTILKSMISPLEDEEILDKSRKLIEVFNDNFSNPDIIWENMGTKDELIKSIYQDKRIFNMKIPNENSYITIAKQLFPIVTEKNISGAFMNLRKDDEFDDLYILMIDFVFSHFRFQAIYHSVPTKISE